MTCRPVLTQLLVPKTTRENGEKFSALNTPTTPQTQDEVQVSANAARLWIILPQTEVTDTKIC